jgi:hypothetical protein
MPTSCTTYTSTGQVVNLTYNLPTASAPAEQNPGLPTNFLFTTTPTGNNQILTGSNQILTGNNRILTGNVRAPISLASLNPLPPTLATHSTIDANRTTIYDYVQPGVSAMGVAARISSLTSPTPPSTFIQGL